MNIGILTSTDPQLRQQLAANAAAADAGPQTADSEVVAAAKPCPTHNIAPSVRFPSLRAALDARIAADVSSGTLPAKDAVAVGTMLDQIDSRSGPGVTPVTAIQPPQPAARAYLATIGRGTLIDRWA